MKYYQCEQYDKQHDLISVKLSIDDREYPNAVICRRCWSVYDFQGLNYKRIISGLQDMDISQFKLKKESKLFQHTRALKLVAKAHKAARKFRAASLTRIIEGIRQDGIEASKKNINKRSIMRIHYG